MPEPKVQQVQMLIDSRMMALILLMRDVCDGSLEIKVQDGVPVRAFRTRENIDLEKMAAEETRSRAFHNESKLYNAQ